ncbi:hypothetical protein C2E23DRAFT_857914 [Lenzites betulinus]|nr:hypothetical protein C2E23DRAFT_857914 [Lenzites betulinus]
MAEPIVFYDIPSKDGAPGYKAMSPNTWKIRYALNIKGIKYRTVWVELHSIEAMMRKIGAPATGVNPDGSPYYSLPTIYDPSTKKAVTDSATIVRYLDKTYPDTPQLVPAETDALHAALDDTLLTMLVLELVPVVVFETGERLAASSQPYFRKTREAMMGGKLEEIAPPGPKREKHWATVQKAFHTVAQWLQAGGVEKRFFLGDRIGYADLCVASYLMWTRVVLGEDSKEWADMVRWDGGRWGRLAEALKEFESEDAGENAVL